MSRNTRIRVSALIAASSAAIAWGFPFGPPPATTIAPGDRPGVSCMRCHAGTALNGGGGSVKIAFPGGLTYTPGQVMNLTVTVDDSAASIYGFQMAARLDSAPSTMQGGNFTPGPSQKVICADNTVEPAGGCGGNGLQWLEHTQPNLSNTFSVQWTPPSAGAGNVHLYVSANAANGDNSPRNDHIYAADYVLVPASTATSGVPVVSGILNGASGAGAIESGSWITINGTNFATATATWDNAIVGGVFPTTLGGATVSINGKPAPLSFVSPTQINALAPADDTLGPVSVLVSNAVGSSAAATVDLSVNAPGFFTLPQAASRYIAAVVLDASTSFEVLAPAGALGTSQQSRPAKPGDVILLFGTGFGRTTTPLNPEVAQNVAIPLAHSGPDIKAPLTTVTIGGKPAQVLFAGIVSPGVYQLNVVVPQVANGDQPVVLSLLSGGSTSQSVFIPVQQ